MATTTFRSSNSRFLPAILVLTFLVLEVAVGGRALGAIVEQAVQAQSAASNPFLQ
jgi:hypothetical protein